MGAVVFGRFHVQDVDQWQKLGVIGDRIGECVRWSNRRKKVNLDSAGKLKG